MANPPIVLLAFANDREGQFLRSIAEEQRSIRKALAPLVEKKLLQLEELPNATAQDIFDAFRRFSGRINIFHYGGHADDLELLLNGSDTPMDVRGLAQFLGQQKGIELVFMNGCATAAQKAPFQKAGIPRLILTDTPISDKAALQFASQFYQSLAAGHPISQSFEEAEGATVAQFGDQRRSLIFEEVEESESGKLPWRLFDTTSEVWALPTKAPFPWLLTGIGTGILTTLALSGYWFWLNVMPFDMRLQVQYPEGINDELHFATPYKDIHHTLMIQLPERRVDFDLEPSTILEIPQVKGDQGTVPLRLDSKYLILKDSSLHISGSLGKVQLDWHPDLKNLRGRVRGESGESLSGVTISLNDVSVLSGKDGRFVLPIIEVDVPRLSHIIRLEKEGYQPLDGVDVKLSANQPELVLVLLSE